MIEYDNIYLEVPFHVYCAEQMYFCFSTGILRSLYMIALKVGLLWLWFVWKQNPVLVTCRICALFVFSAEIVINYVCSKHILIFLLKEG